MENGNEHLSLICDISDLANLVSDSQDIDTFLQRAVRLVAGNLNADVGSIYLYDEPRDELVLAATVGLNPEAVGNVRMSSGEGLIGSTMTRMAPICEGCAAQNPQYKYFESAKEERFHSFLSVPISLGKEKIGVLAVQHEKKDFFNQNDIMALRAIASQLAGTVANARMMKVAGRTQKASDRSTPYDNLRIVRGEATVGGFASAPSAVLHAFNPLGAKISEEAYANSLEDYQAARQLTMEQLKKLQDQLVQRLPESTALIFEAHHMILKDPRFNDQISTRIRQGIPASVAITGVAQAFMDLFHDSANPYIKEKAQDIEDLARRLLYNLKKEHTGSQGPLEGRIVIAADLFPSDLLKLASESVAGIIFVGGGVTSHVAIIARSLKIPMILTNNTDLLSLPEGTPVLMDAEIGTIYVKPARQIRDQFQARNKVRSKVQPKSESMKPETHTKDGHRIELFANINLLSELQLAKELKAEGIGLYRSEFPFIVRSDFPSEEEQRVVYSRLIEAMAGSPVYIRTLDVGGDKILPYLNIPKENNPELGLRSIRFSLQYRHIFEQQIRAILRAGSLAKTLGIMFPMISSIDEFETARQIVTEIRAALGQEGLDHHVQPQIGAMIETPALIPIMDELARRVDFFSIGTNDFIQYLLAVDRTNENVAAYYDPYHPSVLRTLAQAVAGAKRFNKTISVCGEVAHQRDYIPFLIGIGVNRLSVDPQFLPEIQKGIEAIDWQQAHAFAERLLTASTLSAVKQIMATANPVKTLPD